jgi:hypothetical protein
LDAKMIRRIAPTPCGQSWFQGLGAKCYISHIRSQMLATCPIRSFYFIKQVSVCRISEPRVGLGSIADYHAIVFPAHDVISRPSKAAQKATIGGNMRICSSEPAHHAGISWRLPRTSRLHICVGEDVQASRSTEGPEGKASVQ